MDIEKMHGKQIEGLTEDEILIKIQQATTIKEMNELRINSVKFLGNLRGREILESWQKKYWLLKNCPTCGHSL